jgi:hypothetical protein
MDEVIAPREIVNLSDERPKNSLAGQLCRYLALTTLARHPLTILSANELLSKSKGGILPVQNSKE